MKRGALLAQGRTAEVFVWDDDFILKLFHDWCPEDWITHEVWQSRRVKQLGLPVPRLLEQVTVNGRRGIVYERVRGTSLLQLITSQPWRVRSLARILARLQADIHAQSGAGFPALRDQSTRAIHNARALSPCAKEQALAWLARLPDGEALCHYDFHPDQVLMTEKGPVIIDWMTAGCGHPLADVARTSLLLTFGSPPGQQRLRSLVIGLFGRLLHDSYLQAYLALHPGMQRADVERWKVPLIAARLNEDIAGEREALLAYLRRELADGDLTNCE